MADPPSWSYDISDAARFVAAQGLDTSLEPSPIPLDRATWTRLVDDCVRHGLTGLLVDAVVRDALLVTADQRAEAGRLESDLVRRRISYERRVGPILSLFDEAGIEVRILKGVAVARCEYSDDQLRGTSDLDVLVHADKIDEASSLLVAASGKRTDPDPTPGWTSRVGKGATLMLSAANMEVDLHRILVWGPLGVRVPADELWEPSRPFDLAGVRRRTLAREETLLHACAHLLILGVERAREVRDVAQIASNPSLDVTRLLDLARRWGQESVLATALVFAHRELALGPNAHPLVGWAHDYRMPRLDALWLKAGAAQDRIHGVEQLGVWWELRRDPRPWEARRILLRANLCPRAGTYDRPTTRLRRLVERAIGGGRDRCFE